MDRQEQIIQERLQRLTERMSQLGYNNYMVKLVKERVGELQQKGVNCVDRFVQKLLYRVGSDISEAYQDISIEGRFAVILARNGFSGITFIKEDINHKLPDIRATWNRNEVNFELTGQRPNEQDNEALAKAISVDTKTLQNIIGKIQSKLGQLKDRQINIVVLWSETVESDPPQLEEAFKYIQQEIDQNLNIYTKMSGILFTESRGLRFYLFKNDKASKTIGARLTKKLESLYERDIKQLQREEHELAASLRRTMNSECVS